MMQDRIVSFLMQRLRLPEPLLRLPEYSRSSMLTASVAYCGIAGAIGLVLLSAPISASRVVLDDMDCVVEPSLIVNLGSAVPGLIAKTEFDRSDYVAAGTVMAQLESRVEMASLAIAEEIAAHKTGVELREAAAEFGERTQRRNSRLLKTSVISKQNMDQVNTETRIAQLQVQQEVETHRLAALEVDRARAVLDRRRIVSPIDGTVVEKYKSAGEYIDSDAVYKLAQLNPLHVEVIVPMEYLGQIESGMKAGVELLLPGFENDVLDAVVRRIDAVSDAASGTYGVRLVLDNPDMIIPSGVRCQVDFFAS